MSHYVYEIKNKINNKTYVGVRTIGANNPFNDGYLGSGKIIKLAVEKYGVDAFDKKIICITSKEHAYWTEKKIVNDMFVARDDTYNLKVGGEGGAVKGRKGMSPSIETRRKLRYANLGKRPSAETKRKMSASAIGIARPKNDEHRRKISESLKGRPSCRKGQTASEETKRKIREARSKQIMTDETKLKISIAMKKRHFNKRKALNV